MSKKWWQICPLKIIILFSLWYKKFLISFLSDFVSYKDSIILILYQNCLPFLLYFTLNLERRYLRNSFCNIGFLSNLCNFYPLLKLFGFVTVEIRYLEFKPITFLLLLLLSKWIVFPILRHGFCVLHFYPFLDDSDF